MYFRCSEYQNLFCIARIMLDDNEKICTMFREHNHEPTLEQNDTIDVSKRISYMNTPRGGKYIILDDKKFVQSSPNYRSTIHFRCPKYTKQCRARIAVRNEVALASGVHNHN